MRYGKGRSGWWSTLWLVGCAGATPAVERTPGPVPVAAPTAAASGAGQPAAAALDAARPQPLPATPPAAPYVAGPERRISWYGLSLDLSDVWRDATNYEFKSPSEPIQHLVFARSELEPAQVRAWLQEVRGKLDGAYAAKPSGVQPYDNPNYFVLGVHVRLQKESLYFLLATVDDKVVDLTARCRSECDTALRDIVRSLKAQGVVGTGAAQKLKGARQRYSAIGLTFDSSMTFDTPSEFSLSNVNDQDRIICTRHGEPPADAELPPGIHWSYAATQELAKAPRFEETLTGKSSEARAAVVRVYRREADGPNGSGVTVPFSSTSAVISIGSDFLHCRQIAGPTSPELLARFHRLFESARYE